MRIGIRLWLTAAFAAVSLITAAAVYFFGDKPHALIAAVVIGVLAGLLIAVAISHRVVGLARAAGEMAGGSFDAPLKASGPDEIGDLARARRARTRARSRRPPPPPPRRARRAAGKRGGGGPPPPPPKKAGGDLRRPH